MSVWNSMLDVLLPVRCAVCDGSVSTGLICARCCARSSVPVAPPAGLAECRSLGPYADGLGTAVRRAKYDRNLVLMDQLGLWLGRSVTGWAEVDAIVPIPTSINRMLLRGFDHGHRLARGVAQVNGIPLRPVLVTRGVSHQVGKSAWSRKQLGIDTFQVRGRLDGLRVLLVDDVVTTGTTLSTAASVLSRRGASEVRGLVVAHTARKGNFTLK